MIVLHDRRVVILQIPKTATTSTKAFFQDAYRGREGSLDIYWGVDFREGRHVDVSHLGVDDLVRFFPEYADFEIHTVVRNPYDRLYSAFRSYARKAEAVLAQAHGRWPVTRLDMTFREFVSEVVWEVLRDGRLWSDNMYVHLRPCVHFLGARGADVLLRFESFEQVEVHFRALARTRARFPSLNNSGGACSSAANVYGPVELTVVHALSHEDFLTLGYQKRRPA